MLYFSDSYEFSSFKGNFLLWNVLRVIAKKTGFCDKEKWRLSCHHVELTTGDNAQKFVTRCVDFRFGY